ncbi:MAG: DNA polymerase III subunit delta [Deltaproteobacteria bacterium]|nr:DNA polymerase III subunit delta [Deltaproteobacteria bacterium]
MPKDLTPEYVLGQLEKGHLFPFYLFYGQEEFQLENALNKIRNTFIPEDARDLNIQIFYGEKKDDITDPADILDAARTLPFISPNRLIIVRRTDKFPASALESFIPYLDKPAESTCLIFISQKPDFRRKFYSKIRKLGRAVNFRKLSENKIVPWIKRTAEDLGLNMETQACAYLQQIVGNSSMDLYSELEKLYVRYGNMNIGMDEVKELAIYSRIYTIFELMDEVSEKSAKSLSLLNRFLEEEGKDGINALIGMLNRQIKLLWQTKLIVEEGGQKSDVMHKLNLRDFQVKKFMPQSKHWSIEDLERAFHLLYQADGLLKSDSHKHLVLENLVISLCK